MPDPTILSRDPLQRAKADAEAKYGRWRRLLPTLSACLASSLIVAAAAEFLGVGADPARSLKVISMVIAVATLIAYACEWHLLKRKARLIDQRWRVLTAEAARLREAHSTAWQGLAHQRRG